MSELAAGEIKFDELPKFSGPTETAAKTVNTKAPKNGQVFDEERLAILKKEKAEAEAGLANETADLARTTDENYRKKLQASIPRYVPDIISLNKEISSITGEPAPGVINWAGMPKYAPPKNKDESSIGANAIAAGAGAAAGAYYGARKPLNTADNSLAARLMERQYGLPAGSLAAFEGALAPSMPTPAEASLEAARRITPSTPVSEPAPTPAAETPLSAMEKWAASQVGKESVLPANVIGQATSNYADDPTGAPQIIREQAANTRLARQLASPSLMQTSAGGIPYVESPQEQRARIVAQENAQRQAAIDKGLNQPIGAVPTPAQQQQTVENTAAKIRAASARAHTLQRGANVAVRGAFGAPLVAQGYDMATQEGPIDWQQWLSLFGGGLGTFGPLTSKIPGIASRLPVAGPLGALAQVPYAYQEFMKENPTGDVDLGKYLPPSMRTKTRP